MTCSANIATRTGLHLPCRLDDGHDGPCMPCIADVPRQRQLSIVEASEAQFVQHLLSIVESAGGTLTFAEALNIARGLLRARLGRPEFPF